MWVVKILEHVLLDDQFFDALNVLSTIPIYLEKMLCSLSQALATLLTGFVLLRYLCLRRLQVKILIGFVETIIDLRIMIIELCNCLIQIQIVQFLAWHIIIHAAGPLIHIFQRLCLCMFILIAVQVFIDLRQNVIVFLMCSCWVRLGRGKIMAQIQTSRRLSTGHTKCNLTLGLVLEVQICSTPCLAL